MQLRLCQEDMGVVTLGNKVMLDDLDGIHVKGSGTLHVMAYGMVTIKGETVSLYGKEGVETYEAKITPEGGVSVKAMITLSAADGDGNVDIRGGQKTYYLAWEHGDLGDPSYRYRDAPEQKDYEWDKLAANVAGGVALSLGLGLVTYGFGTLVVSGSTAAGLGISVCISGTWYTGMQAVSDAVSGRVSSSDTYLRKALAGSIVGFLSGASALASAGAGLGQTMGIAFAEGFAGDAVSQHIIDGEINWDQAIASGASSSLMAGALWSWRNPGVKVTEATTLDSNAKISNVKDLSPQEIDSIIKYTGDDYWEINRSLRGLEEVTSVNQATIDNVKSALDKSGLPNDMTLYRGTSTNGLGSLKDLPPDQLVGKTFTEPGFMSTSTNNSVAAGTFQGNMQMTIEAPMGTRGIDVAPISTYSMESEVLLQAGTEMYIKDAKMVDNVLYVTVKIIN